MDGMVNDFFNEINQIVPPKESKNEQVWQECYDSSSGYSYYWNIKTDEVTWEMPADYKLWKEQNASNKFFVPPKPSPLFPNSGLSTTRIYKIERDAQCIATDEPKPPPRDKNEKKGTSKTHSKDVTEERVVLISSYGEDSEESGDESSSKTPKQEDKPEENQKNNASQNNSDNEDDTDLLTQIQDRAKVLKDLGGELPQEVKQLVEKDDVKAESKKNVTGFSLLASYADSDDDDDKTENVDNEPPPDKKDHLKSFLFPIIKTDAQPNVLPEEEPENLDLKAFNRKRRINVDFINKKFKAETTENGQERRGLGFKSSDNKDNASTNSKISYSGFQSGGVMFVKSEILQPPSSNEAEKKEDHQKNTSENGVVQIIEETRHTLQEKLNFLCEGRESASPVQVMIIQMETLYEAMKAGGLTSSYLQKWLEETCAELIKLEKDAAPSGWLLQWDRVNKRYYYRNQQTGESQWDYPQPDVIAGEDAMDISTTPPPSNELLADDEVSATNRSSAVQPPPPPPPKIKCPTPPPPPSISRTVETRKKVTKKIPLPPEGAPVEKTSDLLPPGVEASEVNALGGSYQGTDDTVGDKLGSALNSFYSDLAALETETGPVVNELPIVNEAEPVEKVPKKKKPKVKLTQGLAMKKKGVSKLVERWKNVQKDY